MRDLSVIIPARNEEFLELTIKNVLKNKRADTEILAMLDGYLPDPSIDLKDVDSNGDVIFVYNPESIGQRASVNQGAKMSDAKYIMKLDAHCAVDEGFDIKLMETMEHDWTVIPRMYNLHAFNWKCSDCGHFVYQGPQPDKCEKCESKDLFKDIVFKPRKSRKTDFMRFDTNMKFTYWKEYEKRPESRGDIVPLLSSVGACFFMGRDRFWELGGMDEGHGSWGQFGTEVACKAWLSGGQHLVNKKTWFSHMFRTKKDFGFPYPIKYKDQEKARKYSQDLWKNNKWDKAVHNLDWLLEKFKPIPEWHDGKQIEVKQKTKTTKAKVTPTTVESDTNVMLSVIIPARNEEFLQNTIDDIKKNFVTNYEILVGIDGEDSLYFPKKQDNVKVYASKKRIGMRPMINILASKATGKYLMKTDAHCAFDEGYDKKLIDICKPGNTVLGVRYELSTKRWERRKRTRCDFRYLSNPEVDELGGLRGLAWPERYKEMKNEDMAESMSLSGSGWLMHKAQWDAFGPLDENHGSFGQEGAEIACRTWLSGGRLLINRETWYAHWNRGKAPYRLGTGQRDKSVDYSIDFWMNDKWPLQKYSFWWLIEKFNPPGWEGVLDSVIGEGIRKHRQGTLFKGSRVKYRDEHHDMSVDTLWEQRLAISQPLKRWRLKLMYDSLFEIIEGLKAGKTYDTVEEIRKTRYFHYLTTHLAKKVFPQNKDEYLEKWDKYIIKKFKSAISLFESIRDEGLETPLEFYRGEDYIYLWKGYRRLVILKALGIKEVPVVTHIDNRCLQLPPMFVPESKKNIKSIDKIAEGQFLKYGGRTTDKYWTHRYTPIYDKVFNDLRSKEIELLEIGVARGASLLLWHEAFPKAKIYGIDKSQEIWKEMAGNLNRVEMFIGKQQDLKFLESQIIPKGPFDIIIDDCGHNPTNQMISFNALWEHVKPHGFYVMEDCYVSYERRNKGRPIVPEEFAKFIANIYTNQSVLSIQYYYNICFIQKGITEV